MLSVRPEDHSLERRTINSLDQAPPTNKQHQHNHPDSWRPSQQFWDALPRIYLTRRALVEHDRRVRAQESGSQGQRHQRRSRRLRKKQPRYRQYPIGKSKLNRELRRFALHGGPDLTGIRGFPDPTMSDETNWPNRSITTTGRTTSARRSTPYDPNYELMLARNGIHVDPQTDADGRMIRPANYDAIRERLREPRPSLSPSHFTEEDFLAFQLKTLKEKPEKETMSNSLPVIEGTNERIYRHIGGMFNNLEPFGPDFAMAVPDSYDGARPLSIHSRLYSELSEHIVPSTDDSRPALPNFFLEGKSRKGRGDVAKRQAAHVGAIGARGMMSMQTYPSRAPIYDNKAYTFTSTYHEGQLRLYTTHMAAPQQPGQPPQYHMTPIRSFSMTDDSDTFRQGATHYRNARDIADENRTALILEANKKGAASAEKQGQPQPLNHAHEQPD